MCAKWRILLVEDQRLVRETLKGFLDLDQGYEVVGEASDGLEAIRLVDRLKPDLVILDLAMPKADGFELLSAVKKSRAKIRILVVTGRKEEDYVLRALREGADGYLLKEEGIDELLNGMKAVLRGERYLSASLVGLVIDGFVHSRDSAPARSPLDLLSSREREILKLIAEGQNRQQIADRLCISAKTVDKHRENLTRKLNRRGVAALTSYAIEKGLLSC